MNNTAENKLYTYADYKNYSEGEPIEIIDGLIYNMSPAPSRVHQEIISELLVEISNYIRSKKGHCKVYPAPFDVFLIEGNTNIDDCKNIVQPDISVICDKNKLNDKGCVGAPDMIIEVVSPFNPNSDYIRKLTLYDHFKVREYWIVNPMKQTVLIYKLNDTMQYADPETYTFKDKIKVGIYDDLEIDFNSLEL
jgi:Uma2 family endonuclease